MQVLRTILDGVEAGHRFLLVGIGQASFTERIIVSTTDKWNPNAEDAIKNQQVPVRRIGVSDLEASPVSWVDFNFSQTDFLVSLPQNHLRPHQQEAIKAVRAGFDSSDRGKLIMACGTGKTFTSLKLAEKTVGAGGTVLFLSRRSPCCRRPCGSGPRRPRCR